MPKKKARTTTIDPSSDAVVLTYVGDGRSARNTPARDLTQNDVARLAYQRSLAAVAADVGQPIDREDPDSPLYERPDPRDPDPAVIAEILGELLGTGLYEGDIPEAAQEPAPPDTNDTPPAAPATEVPQP